MPMPRMPLRIGNSVRASAVPKISFDNRTIKERRRMFEEQEGQPGASRSRFPAASDAPQMLQVAGESGITGYRIVMEAPPGTTDEQNLVRPSEIRRWLLWYCNQTNYMRQ
jgi:hypothetical protein